MKRLKNSLRFFLCVALLIVVITIFYSQLVVISVEKFNGITIVLDAGHGGLDVK